MANMILRIPDELKQALDTEAKRRGVSVNRLATDALTAMLGYPSLGPKSAPTGLDPEITLAELIKARDASEARTYKQIAEVHGFAWGKVYRKIGPHLCEVWDLCRARDLPPMTVLVVGQDSYRPGKGFFAEARRRGYDFDDEEAFFERCMEEVCNSAPPEVRA